MSLSPALLTLGSSGCKKETPPPTYQSLPVVHRDIVVSAQASGSIQPDTTVEVKSKASGEILDLAVETGQSVKRGDLMVRVDPRISEELSGASPSRSRGGAGPSHQRQLAEAAGG